MLTRVSVDLSKSHILYSFGRVQQVPARIRKHKRSETSVQTTTGAQARSLKKDTELGVFVTTADSEVAALTDSHPPLITST